MIVYTQTLSGEKSMFLKIMAVVFAGIGYFMIYKAFKNQTSSEAIKMFSVGLLLEACSITLYLL
jgi:hypothetical protein